MTRVGYQSTTAMGVYLKLGPAPGGGAVFSLQIKAGETAHVTFPPTVTIPAGETDRQFEIAWASAGTTVLQAQLTEYAGVPKVGTVYERTVIALPEQTVTLLGVDFEVTLDPETVALEGMVDP